MKAIHNYHKRERGQILVIVALAMVALMAMAMLLLDGGALLVNRRAAQNAADAAALAGAREYCRNKSAVWGDPTDLVEDDITDIIDDYATVNNATVLWGDDQTYPTDENVGKNGIVKGEIVVTVQVEHDSFFARIFGEDTLTATATAGAGCFPYGPEIVLPIAFPCSAPELTSIPGITSASHKCDYSMLRYTYFDTIATETCGMSYNPLQDEGEVDPQDAECISKALINLHPELIYIVMGSNVVCAKDPENVDPTTEIICDLVQDGHTQLSSASHAWLNLEDYDHAPASADKIAQWIAGEIPSPSVREHTWLSFVTGKSMNKPFKAMEEHRILDIVWIPVYNYACDSTDPIPQTCFDEAHDGWTEYDDEGKIIEEHPGIPPDEGGDCYVINNNPGQMFAHVVAFAPFFTTCVRNGSLDLQKYTEDTPENFVGECPGWEMTVKASYEDTDENTVYPNFEYLSKNENEFRYTLEGYFIEPWYLDNPESITIGGADLGVYTAQLTR